MAPTTADRGSSARSIKSDRVSSARSIKSSASDSSVTSVPKRPKGLSLIEANRKAAEATVKRRDLFFKKKAEKVEETERLALEARKVPIDALAGEWLSKQHGDNDGSDKRSYFVEKLLPSLILGLEQLLKRVDSLGLMEEEDLEGKLNPINDLAQYLMRNNPKYSNFAEASPYMKSLNAIRNQLKGHVIEVAKQQTNSLHDEVLKRISSANEAIRAEEEAAWQRRVAVIPDIWKAACKWMAPEEDLGLQVLVKGLLEFNEYLIDNGKEADASVKFFDNVPDASTINEEERVKGGELLDFLESSTQVLRRHPNSKQLVPDLISHMTQWFDLQKIHIGGTSRKKYKQLFKDCDVNEEGELDKETVIATAKTFATSEHLPENERESYVHGLGNWMPGSAPVPIFEDAYDKAKGRPSSAVFMAKDGLSLAPTTQKLAMKARQEEAIQEEKNLPGFSVADDDVEDDFMAGTISDTGSEKSTSFGGSLGASRASAFFMDARTKRWDKPIDFARFQNMCGDLLGTEPRSETWQAFRAAMVDAFQKHREVLAKKYRERVILEKRSKILDAVMERIDIDCSGFIEEDELAPVLARWHEIKEDEGQALARKILQEAGPEDDTGILRLGKARFTHIILNRYFNDMTEMQFEREIGKLNRCLDHLLPNHNRFVQRREWLLELEQVGRKCVTQPEELYSRVFEILAGDSDMHSTVKQLNSAIALTKVYGGHIEEVEIIAASENNVLNKEGQKLTRKTHRAVFDVIDSGLPLNITNILDEQQRKSCGIASLLEAPNSQNAEKGVTEEADSSSVDNMDLVVLSGSSNGCISIFPLVDVRNASVTHGVIGALIVHNIRTNDDSKSNASESDNRAVSEDGKNGPEESQTNEPQAKEAKQTTEEEKENPGAASEEVKSTFQETSVDSDEVKPEAEEVKQESGEVKPENEEAKGESDESKMDSEATEADAQTIPKDEEVMPKTEEETGELKASSELAKANASDEDKSEFNESKPETDELKGDDESKPPESDELKGNAGEAQSQEAKPHSEDKAETTSASEETKSREENEPEDQTDSQASLEKAESVTGLGDVSNEVTERFDLHQIRFFQGVAGNMGEILPKIHTRKAISILASQNTLWLQRISPEIKSVQWYHVTEVEGDPFGTELQTITTLPLSTGANFSASFAQGTKVERNRNTAYLFRTVDLRDPTVAKLKDKDMWHRSYPVLDTTEVMMLCVITMPVQDIDPSVDRAIRRQVHEMEEALAILLQGDFAPEIAEVQDMPPSCTWHRSVIDMDNMEDTKKHWLRFQLLAFRRDITKAFKMLFFNLNSLAQPSEVVLAVVQAVVLAFVGGNEEEDTATWEACRRFVNTDLKRAICSLDPSHEIYLESLNLAADKLKNLTRLEVMNSNQPLVTMLYDWLCVSIALSRRAAVIRKKHAAGSYQSVKHDALEGSPLAGFLPEDCPIDLSISDSSEIDLAASGLPSAQTPTVDHASEKLSKTAEAKDVNKEAVRETEQEVHEPENDSGDANAPLKESTTDATSEQIDATEPSSDETKDAGGENATEVVDAKNNAEPTPREQTDEESAAGENNAELRTPEEQTEASNAVEDSKEKDGEGTEPESH
eukprot:m.64817 g.64817  ORF g.64817 m.64817 type:complete len:1602 (-) comp11677_c0_seq1:30-4835(-)